jgi:hypothetical protein
MSEDAVARIMADLPPPPPNGTDGAGDLLRRWTMAELLAEPDDFRWLVKGLLVDPTYGQIGGELKTLKSVIASFVTVAIAAGEPLFGHFDVATARPVVAYVGEGGRKPYKRRLRRIAQAMGVKLDDLPLFPVFDVAPIQSDIFRETLSRDLRDVEPGLVTLDPLYMYHGTATRATDLHQEGALLGVLSRPCIEAGVSVQIVNHFNQTGYGVNLKRITMAGSGEWADSWMLLAHRVDPDVEQGAFKLLLEVGSRQWGGSSWALDLTLGRFDTELGEHEGDIAWEIRRRAIGADQSVDRVLAWAATRPFQLTKEELAAGAGGKRARIRDLIDTLVDTGRLTMVHGSRVDSRHRSYKTWLYGPKGADDAASPTSDGGTLRLSVPPEKGET